MESILSIVGLFPFIYYILTYPRFFGILIQRRKMTALLVLGSFLIGFVSCYFYMTKGVDQDGVWVSNKPFEDD